MITGDHLNIAKKTAAQIKLGQNMFANDALWPVAIAYPNYLPISSLGFAIPLEGLA